MPVTPTYPGVYIEEIRSGVRTIVDVATSITAFVGRALRGPVNEPVRIQGFGDYTRTFGRLSVDSTMSYAVEQYFRNGGADALIVRVHNGAAAATITLPAGGDNLTLVELRAPASGLHDGRKAAARCVHRGLVETACDLRIGRRLKLIAGQGSVSEYFTARR